MTKPATHIQNNFGCKRSSRSSPNINPTLSLKHIPKNLIYASFKPPGTVTPPLPRAARSSARQPFLGRDFCHIQSKCPLAKVLSVCRPDHAPTHTCFLSLPWGSTQDAYGLSSESNERTWATSDLVSSCFPADKAEIHVQQHEKRASPFIYLACVNVYSQLFAPLSTRVPYDCSIHPIVVLYRSFRYDATKGFMHVVTIKSVLQHFSEPRHSLNCNCF